MPFQWLQSIPPVTRTYVACSTALSLADYMGYIKVSDIFLSPNSSFGLNQLWRILLNTAYNGTFSFEFCTRLYLFTSYSNWVETYVNSPRHYIWTLFVLIFMINLYSAFIKNLGLIGPVLKDTLLCIWSRKQSDDEVFFFIISLKVRWLPWATYLLDSSINYREDPKRFIAGPAGLIIGHCFWFINEELPRLHGNKSFLRPVWEWEIFNLETIKPEENGLEETTETGQMDLAQVDLQDHQGENQLEENLEGHLREMPLQHAEVVDDHDHPNYGRETRDTLHQRNQ